MFSIIYNVTMNIKSGVITVFGKRSSIRYKLLLGYSILMIFTILISTAVYFVTAKVVERNLSEASLKTLERINMNIEKDYYRINIYMDMLILNKSITDKILKNPDLKKLDSSYYEVAIALDEEFETIYPDVNDLVSMIIFKNEEGFYRFRSGVSMSEGELRSMEWYNETIDMQGAINWIGVHENYDKISDNRYVFSVARAIRDLKTNGEIIGVGYLAFNDNLINSGYGKNLEEQNSTILIIDQKGSVVTHTDMSKLQGRIDDKMMGEIALSPKGYYIEKISGERVMISYCTSSQTQWTTIEILPLKYVLKGVNIFKYVFVLTIILFISIYILIYNFFKRKVIQPVRILLDAMKQAEKGNFSTSIGGRSPDEIQLIYDGFNKMLERIKNLFESSIHQEKEKKRITIEMMQANINFHFLYNTLHTIKLKAMLKGYTELCEMVTSLAIILKNNFVVNDALISVEEEIKCLDNYMLIQKSRYGNGIKMEKEIDTKVTKFLMPNLILQPLVENALFHGLSPKGNIGTITIKSYIEDECLIFEIIDDGVGMSEEALETTSIGQSRNSSKGGIGMNNVHERIRLLYSGDFGIKVTSTPLKGTVVTVKLPVICEKEDISIEENING